MSAAFGGRLARGDTIRVVRTPIFQRVRAVQRPPEDRQDRWYPLLDIGLFVVLGFVPLLSFGKQFAVYSSAEEPTQYHVVYVLPALIAEALYVWLLVHTLGGG